LKKKESNFGKKKKVGKKWQNAKTKKEECTVGFVCGGTMIPSHHLDIS